MLEIKNLSKTFNQGTSEENQLFSNFTLSFEDRECTAILGPNGCGKSTLFNLISGQLKPDQGSISLDGLDLTALREEERALYIGKVSQDPSKGVSPSLSVLENMSIARKKGKPFSLKSLVRREHLGDITDQLKSLNLGLEHKLSTKVGLLSGGQRQSLSLLMATMVRPKLLLLDEHTAALDPKTSRLVMEKTLDLIKKEKMMTLMITHNLRNAVQFSDRLVMLSHGQVLFDLRSRDISEKDLEDLYYRTLEENLGL